MYKPVEVRPNYGYTGRGFVPTHNGRLYQMRKHGLAQRAGEFLEGKGFYIVLFLCVAAIGISGYYLFHSMTFTPDTPDSGLTVPVDGSAKVVVTPSIQPVKPAVDPTPTPPPPETTAPEETETLEPVEAPALEPSAVTTMDEVAESKEAPALFVWPLNGATVTAFSPNALIRDETMGDWRVHEGVDLSCALGAEVMASAEGVVDSVEKDGMLGTVITIRHGGDISTVYANLSEEVEVMAGDEVIAGTVIGTVGSTAIAESGLDPHLHFAMYRNGEPLDPKDFMPSAFL